MDVAEESFVAVEFDRALLARVAPSFAHSGAAELLGAHDTLQLALAHVVVDARETRARPVIFYGDQQKNKTKVNKHCFNITILFYIRYVQR